MGRLAAAAGLRPWRTTNAGNNHNAAPCARVIYFVVVPVFECRVCGVSVGCGLSLMRRWAKPHAASKKSTSSFTTRTQLSLLSSPISHQTTHLPSPKQARGQPASSGPPGGASCPPALGRIPPRNALSSQPSHHHPIALPAPSSLAAS